jgi:hypothetical protein
MMKFLEYAINENFDFGTQPESGKVFIEEDGDEADDWNLALDISAIWKRYENKEISHTQLNQQYSKFLTVNKSQILEFVEDKQEFEETLQKLNEETDLDKSETLWNKLYDICDKNEILLKA